MADGTETQDTTTAGTGETGTPKTFSQEDVNKMLTEVRTAALADIGRVRKTAEESIKRATESVTTRFTTLMAQQTSEFEEIVKDNPDAVTTIREKNKARQAEQEKVQLKAELDELNTRLATINQKEQETERTTLTQTIASIYSVDATTLGRLSKFTDGSKEQIEQLAKDLPKLTGNSSGGGRPDSTQTHGGSKGLTLEDVKRMSPAERNRRTKEIAAIPFSSLT